MNINFKDWYIFNFRSDTDTLTKSLTMTNIDFNLDLFIYLFILQENNHPVGIS